MSDLFIQVESDPRVSRHEYENAAFEGTICQRVDVGQIWQVQGGAWVLIGTAGTGTLVGDTIGPLGSNTTVGLTGAAGTTAVHMANLTWDAAVATPKIGQLTATAGSGTTFALRAQDGFQTGNTGGGGLSLSSGIGHGTGLPGVVNVAWGGSTVAAFDPTLPGLFLDLPKIVFGNGQLTPSISQQDASSGAGQTLGIIAQRGGAGVTVGGNLFLATGAGQGGGAAGSLSFSLGGTTAAAFTPLQAALTMFLPNILFASSVASPTITQIDSGTGSGQNLLVRGQNASGGPTAGGSVILQSGAKGGAGTDGALLFQWGTGGLVASFDPGVTQGLSMSKPNILFGAAVVGPSIGQAVAASGPGETITLFAQDGQQSGNTNGGGIVLRAGLGHGTIGPGGVTMRFGTGGPSIGFGVSTSFATSTILFSTDAFAPVITQLLTGGVPQTMTVASQSTSGGFQGGSMRLKTGSGGLGPNAPGLFAVALGNNSNASFTIGASGEWDIFTGTAAQSGASPSVVGQIQSNNEVEIFWNELITTPRPDTSGVNAFLGVRCRVVLPVGELDGFFPVYAYVP